MSDTNGDRCRVCGWDAECGCLEPTEEMMEDGMQAMGYKSTGRPYGGARQRFIKGLRAALAVQQKGEVKEG